MKAVIKINMDGLTSKQFQEINRIISKYVNKNSFNFGVITAVDEDNRLLKVNLEPYNVETGWLKVLQGAFTDKIGVEVLVGTVTGEFNDQYVVLGIIE